MAPSKPKLADPGALIRSGKLRTAEFRACMDPDLVADYERLLAAHEQLLGERDEAKKFDTDSLAGGSGVELNTRLADLKAQIADLLSQIEDATVTIVLREQKREEFRALSDKHPPRKDADGKLAHDEDYLGVNFETFYPVLIRMCIVEPVLDAETMDLLLDERLGDRQWEDLTTVAWNLHRKSVNVPFSPAVSRKTSTSSRK